MARYLNIAIVCLIALATGARLADAGYPRWIGIVGTIMILVVVPAISALIAVLQFRMTVADIERLGLLFVVICLLLHLIFVIWAGTRPSQPLDVTNFDDHDSGNDRLRNQIEPRF